MNAKTTKAHPQIDVSALEKGTEDIKNVIALVTNALAEANVMLENCKTALHDRPLDIELQSQVLRLNDYIIKQTQNICTLEGQIAEIERTRKMCDPSENHGN